MNRIADAFKAVWVQVQTIYYQGRIISERHMQAEIYRLLRANPEFDREYQIWVEPKIEFKQPNIDSYLKGTIPDMVITRDEEIVAVVELKYTPLGFLPFEKDVTNLMLFNKLRGNGNYKIALRVNHLTGDYDANHGFSISKDLLLVYCAMARKDSHAFEKASDIWILDGQKVQPPPNYLFLTAEIQAGKGIAKSVTYLG